MDAEEEIPAIPPLDVLLNRAKGEAIRKQPVGYYTEVIRVLKVEKRFTGQQVHDWFRDHGVTHISRASVYKVMATLGEEQDISNED